MDLFCCHSIGISRILFRERGHFGGSVTQKMFLLDDAKTKFMNFNGSLMGLRREK